MNIIAATTAGALDLRPTGVNLQMVAEDLRFVGRIEMIAASLAEACGAVLQGIMARTAVR